MKITPIESENIYKEFSPKVAAYVHSHIRCYEDAEDIVSDVFLKVYQNLDKYDETKASLSTWIYTITRNTVINHYKKRKIDSISLDDAFGLGEEPEDLDDGDEMLDKLNEAMKALTERQRDIVTLHYYFNLDHAEISKKLGISYANTRKICSLALAKMRGYLE